MRRRAQFGKPIASFQLIQDLLAKMLGNLTELDPGFRTIG
jgi:glutaryl-CoA dehydrogenase